MAKKVKDLAVVVGKYEKDGKSKNRYINVGAILEGSDGNQFILLERTFNPAGVANPDGKSTVLISCFDPKGYSAEVHEGSKATQVSVEEDAIPF